MRRDGVGPFQAPLLPEHAQLLELLVHVELRLDLALLLRDARQALGALLALAPRRRQPFVRLAARIGRQL